MESKVGLRIFVLALIGAIIIAYKFYGFDQYLSLESLKNNQTALNQYYLNNPIYVSGLFLVIYIISTALSIPGATILTLAGGALFGFWYGLLLVSFASTIGATLAFLGSRLFFRDFVQNKFKNQLENFNKGFKKEGAFYLFTLRLLPIFPFFLINLLMGLTPIRTVTYFFVSQIGMLAGTAVYVNAGTQLAKIESLSGILSPQLILSFVVIGILPMISKAIIQYFRARKYLNKFKKPKSFDYNMVVIGGGSAGLVSAYIASAVKAKVALVEKHKMGGDCLNTGCVPSKAFIKSAKIFNYYSRAKEFGLDVDHSNGSIQSARTRIDFSKVMDRIQSVIKSIEPHDSIERYTGLGVECFTGEATIVSPYEVRVNERVLTTQNIVIATGASPVVPNIPGLSEVSYLTSENLWGLKSLPKKMLILGGGPIGCELAQSFARFGTDVTIIEMGERIMGREDPDVSEFVTNRFTSESVTVKTNHRALRIDAKTKSLICDYKGQEVQIDFGEILLALGRKANVKGFGLENLNIEISDRGTVIADEFLRTTNYPNIYVCGDVTGPFQFTHVAAHQAWYVAVNALFSPFKKFKVDYRVIPWCTFTDPEVARVGLSETEAQQKGIAFEKTVYGIDDLDRAIAEGEAHGFVKVLTVPGQDKILGVTIVGDHAGDIIAEYVTAMKCGIGLNKILGTIHIYPTLAEANKFAAGVWKKNHAPQKVLNLLNKFFEWRRS